MGVGDAEGLKIMICSIFVLNINNVLFYGCAVSISLRAGLYTRRQPSLLAIAISWTKHTTADTVETVETVERLNTYIQKDTTLKHVYQPCNTSYHEVGDV